MILLRRISLASSAGMKRMSGGLQMWTAAILVVMLSFAVRNDIHVSAHAYSASIDRAPRPSKGSGNLWILTPSITSNRSGSTSVCGQTTFTW